MFMAEMFDVQCNTEKKIRIILVIQLMCDLELAITHLFKKIRSTHFYRFLISRVFSVFVSDFFSTSISQILEQQSVEIYVFPRDNYLIFFNFENLI